MREYKILDQQKFNSGRYSIVPIRAEDRYDIMKWRNEQMYHLRQNEPLSKEKQDFYFDSVISNIFEQDKPTQILFSYLEGEKCIGYGGLVHINFLDKNAEISFIMNTSLEEKYFEFHWSSFLGLIEQTAFKELDLHKIYTYSFDLRPYLYPVLEKNNYFKDARLTAHCSIGKEFKDVVIFAKLNTNVKNRTRND